MEVTLFCRVHAVQLHGSRRAGMRRRVSGSCDGTDSDNSTTVPLGACRGSSAAAPVLLLPGRSRVLRPELAPALLLDLADSGRAGDGATPADVGAAAPPSAALVS